MISIKSHDEGNEYSWGMRLPCLLLVEPNIEQGGNYEAFQETFRGVGEP